MMMFANEQDIYRPKARKIESVKVGDQIKMNRSTGYVSETVNYVVVAVYPYHVRAMCYKTGYDGKQVAETRCFNLGQLVNLGVEKGGGERFRIPASYGSGSDYSEV